MLHKFLNDFLALAPLQLPELINQERMEQPVYEDGYVLLDLLCCAQHNNSYVA